MGFWSIGLTEPLELVELLVIIEKQVQDTTEFDTTGSLMMNEIMNLMDRGMIREVNLSYA